jgi:hypothetical protein
MQTEEGQKSHDLDKASMEVPQKTKTRTNI